MIRATLGAALVVAALAGSAAATAQNVPAPAAQTVVPPPVEIGAPPGSGPIAALQQQLRREGYRPGPINGVMTDETRRALADYMRRTGRSPDALAATAPAQDSTDADPVRRVQADLQRLGLFAGPVDGVLGPQTRDAIIRFEAARHLAIDPRVSDRLLAALDEARADPGTAPPSAPAPASAAPTQTATPETAGDATGRRPLPLGVNPPPIR